MVGTASAAPAAGAGAHDAGLGDDADDAGLGALAHGLGCSGVGAEPPATRDAVSSCAPVTCEGSAAGAAVSHSTYEQPTYAAEQLQAQRIPGGV